MSLAPPAQTQTPPATLRQRALAELDRMGVTWCLMHACPEEESGDIDLIVPADFLARESHAAIAELARRLDARRVLHLRDAADYVVFVQPSPVADRIACGSARPPAMLALHLHTDVESRGRLLIRGERVLAGRRRECGAWVPQPAVEFAAVLGLRLVKTSIQPRHAQRLARLAAEDPAGVKREVEMLLGAEDARCVIDAARSQKWDPLNADLPRLRRVVLRRAARRHPLHLMRRRAMSGLRRAMRTMQPSRAERGLSVVVLGPDGSGKSSVVDALASRLAPVFAGVERRSFPPALRQRPDAATRSDPQAAPPRSPMSSAVRAVAYWWAHAWAAHVGVLTPKLLNNRLILHDRHLMDTTVDPRRYRYGGSLALLWAVVKASPRPDLVILLDAPAGVVQARKGELTLAETRRQLDAYRKLVGGLACGRLVDADAPAEHRDRAGGGPHLGTSGEPLCGCGAAADVGGRSRWR